MTKAVGVYYVCGPGCCNPSEGQHHMKITFKYKIIEWDIDEGMDSGSLTVDEYKALTEAVEEMGINK